MLSGIVAAAVAIVSPASATTYTIELYDGTEADLYGDNVADWFGTVVVPNNAAVDVNIPVTSISATVNGIVHNLTGGSLPMNMFTWSLLNIPALDGPVHSATLTDTYTTPFSVWFGYSAVGNSSGGLDPYFYWQTAFCSNFGCTRSVFGGGYRLIEQETPVVPVPAALPMLASALIGMGWLARRRRR